MVLFCKLFMFFIEFVYIAYFSMLLNEKGVKFCTSLERLVLF